MAAYYGDKKYEGPETIVVAMDIGTTNTAVSFTHLCPGSRPQGKMVAHWPGQANWSGAAKIPSIVSYINGVAKAYGNEAQQDFEGNHSEVAYWFKVIVSSTMLNHQSDWFLKLHLHPTTMLKLSDSQGFEIPALPVNTTIEGVYTDLMRYLMKNTQRVFQMVTPDGKEIWSRLRDAIVIVLAIPNGWAIAEQAILSRAAIKASLVTEENAGHLLHFVAEAEASVHYALAKQEGQWLKRNTVFAVIDCGGSTIDTTVYRCVSTDPLRLKEACPSECVQAGGIFINREVEKLLKEKLRDSAFDDPEIMRIMMSAFEKELKPTFDGITEEYSFRFGSIKDDDSSLGVAKGRITLLDRELKPAFDLVIEKMIASCFHILVEQKTKYVILVGGFAESPYMQNVLWKRLAQHEIAPIMGVDYAKKAAAEGAVIAHIKQFVVARVVKATIGGCVRESYNKKLHRERKHLARLYPDGKKRVDGAFHAWVKKGDILQGTIVHNLPYHLAWDANSTSESDLIDSLGTTGIEVFAWEGEGIPTWCKDEHGNVLEGMRLICTLSANLATLAGGLQIQNGPHGEKFYRIDYDVCVYYGGTQLCAKMQWKEKGVLRESPIAIMPYVS